MSTANTAPANVSTTWTYEGYWNAVLGLNSAAAVVADFKLVGPRRGVDEWLGNAESEACIAGGLDIPEEWGAFHTRALDALEAAIEA